QPEDVLTHTVRGQYGEGTLNGTVLPAYRHEPDVAATPTTETYAAITVFIETWRWADVPFYLRSGKALPKRLTEIAIQFRRAPLMLFRHVTAQQFQANRLILHIQPLEGISWEF